MASHRYWRLRCSDNAANGTWSLGSLEFRATIGGADLTGSGVASVSGSWNAGSNPPANLFDHNAATWWACNAETGWVAYDFGAPVEVLEVAMTCRPDDHAQPPSAGAVEVSDDGVTWTNFHRFGPLSWAANGQTQTISVTATADPPAIWLTKANISVNSKPTSAVILAKANMAVDSKPAGVVIFSKANLAVESDLPPPTPPGLGRRMSLM
jgi:hypothetical protein